MNWSNPNSQDCIYFYFQAHLTVKQVCYCDSWTLTHRLSLKILTLTFLALAVVGVSPESVVELLLVTVQAGAASGEAVNQSQVSIQVIWSFSTNHKSVFRSRDLHWPIRGQYSGHMTSVNQSQVSIQVTWSVSTNRMSVLPVHLAGVLHVSTLGVEVGHVPAILLIIVVVGVGAEETKLDYKTVWIDFVNK